MISIAGITNQWYHEKEMAEERAFDIAYWVNGQSKASADQSTFFGPLAKTLGLEGRPTTREAASYLMNGFDPAHRLPGKLVALRKNADEQSLRMSIIRLEATRLQKEAQIRKLDKFEQDCLTGHTVALTAWEEALKQTAIIKQRLDEYDKGKTAGFICFAPSKKSIRYTDKHEQERQELAQQYAKMPGAQRCGTDFTYSPDKAINALYVLATDEEKERIRIALKEVSEQVLGERLGTNAQTRRQVSPASVGENGEKIPVVYERVTAQAMASGFVHDSARVSKGEKQAEGLEGTETPQLHFHALVYGISLADDGTFRSLHTDNLEKHRREIDAEITAKLVARLNADGYAIDGGRPRKNAAATLTVPGVTKKELDTISLRSEAIERESERLKAAGEIVNGWQLATATRQAKAETDPQELYGKWATHFENIGLTREKLGMGREGTAARGALQARRAERARLLAEAPEVADLAILKEIDSKKTYFTEMDLREALWRDATKTGVMDVDARFKRIIENKNLTLQAEGEKVAALLSRGNDTECGRLFITTLGLREEREFDKVASRMTAGGWTPDDADAVARSVEDTEAKKTNELNLPPEKPFRFRDDQREIIRRVLCGMERMLVVEAPPGSGKTTALMGAVDYAKKIGRQTIVLAPSHKAKGQAMKDAGVEEGHAVQGFIRSKQKLEGIKAGALIFVDEGSMVDMHDMLTLIKAAEERGAKVVVFGDTNQLAAVGRGDPMRRVTEIAPDAVERLTYITRQRDEAQKAAVWAQYRGDTAEAIERMEKLGLIHVFKDDDEKAKAFASFYFTKDKQGRDIAADAKALTAGTNRDCRLLNDLIRAERVRRGEVAPDGLTLRCETAGGDAPRTFARGDRILFVEGIKDGAGQDAKALADTSDTGTVLGVSLEPDGKSARFRVEIDGKGVVEFVAAHGAALDHAYVLTTHRSQGLTVDLSGHYASAMTGAEALLVGMSRHRDTFGLFATTMEASLLADSAARKTEKTRAADLAPELSVEAERVITKANEQLDAIARQIDKAELYGSAHDLAKAIDRAAKASASIGASVDQTATRIEERRQEQQRQKQEEAQRQITLQQTKTEEERHERDIQKYGTATGGGGEGASEAETNAARGASKSGQPHRAIAYRGSSVSAESRRRRAVESARAEGGIVGGLAVGGGRLHEVPGGSLDGEIERRDVMRVQADRKGDMAPLVVEKREPDGRETVEAGRQDQKLHRLPAVHGAAARPRTRLEKLTDGMASIGAGIRAGVEALAEGAKAVAEVVSGGNGPSTGNRRDKATIEAVGAAQKGDWNAVLDLHKKTPEGLRFDLKNEDKNTLLHCIKRAEPMQRGRQDAAEFHAVKTAMHDDLGDPKGPKRRAAEAAQDGDGMTPKQLFANAVRDRKAAEAQAEKIGDHCVESARNGEFEKLTEHFKGQPDDVRQSVNLFAKDEDGNTLLHHLEMWFAFDSTADFTDLDDHTLKSYARERAARQEIKKAVIEVLGDKFKDFEQLKNAHGATAKMVGACVLGEATKARKISPPCVENKGPGPGKKDKRVQPPERRDERTAITPLQRQALGWRRMYDDSIRKERDDERKRAAEERKKPRPVAPREQPQDAATGRGNGRGKGTGRAR